MTRLDKRLVAIITLALLALTTVFHMLVITGIIPYSIVWGGRLTDMSQVIVFEAVSLLINLIIGYIVLVRGGYIATSRPRVIQAGIWIVCFLFILNTVGNLFSASSLERAIFTPLTLLLALLTYRLALRG